MKRFFGSGSLAMLLATSSIAFAQAPGFTPYDTANVLAGTAALSAGWRPLVGGAVGWDLAPRLSLEFTTKWVIPESGAGAFSATGTLQVPLLRGRIVVPFVRAGAGVHVATFNLETSDVPQFYARRVADSGRLAGTRRAFPDAALVVGGGLSIFASRSLSIRPEVEIMLLQRDARHALITTLAIRVAYRVERHHLRPELAVREHDR